MMPTQTIRCPSCGHETDAIARFCAQCGLVQPGAQFTGPTDASAVDPAGEPAVRDLVTERLRKATIGRFDILRRLGHGGMAAVYLAYDLRLARKVALKVMLPQMELAEGMTDRFVQEAKTAARLTHPNIIIIYSVEELGDMVLIVMSLVDGASLDHVLPKLAPDPHHAHGRLPVATVQSVLVQVATALEYAHAEHVVHRDIKPSNVMITLKGDAIITDFGIAKITADAGHQKSSVVIGTPTYMSPEQCMGRAVTGASDQYSLGAMAYELLCGEPPFSGLHFELVNSHVYSDPVPLLARSPGTPPRLAAAVMRMLAKSTDERFPSMADAADALSSGFDPRDPEPRRLLGAAARAARDESGVAAFQTPRSPVPKPSARIAVSEPRHLATTLGLHEPARLEPTVRVAPATTPVSATGHRKIAGAGLVVVAIAALALWPRSTVVPDQSAATGAQSAESVARRDSLTTRPLPTAPVNQRAQDAATRPSDRNSGRSSRGIDSVAPIRQNAARGTTLVDQGRPVTSPVAARIALTVSSSSLQMGTGGRWSARGVTGTGVDIPNLEFTVRSEPAALARVSPGGEITPLAVGRVTIIASLGSLADSQVVVISAPAEPVVQPLTTRATPPPDSATAKPRPESPAAPSSAEIVIALEPFVAAMRSGAAVSGYFTAGQAGARNLVDWLAPLSRVVVSTPRVVRAGSPNNGDSRIDVDLPVEWHNGIGQCRQAVVRLQAHMNAGRIQVESAAPPSTSAPCGK